MEEVAKSKPDVAEVARRTTVLAGVARRLRATGGGVAGFGKRVKDKAQDKAAEIVATAIVGGGGVAFHQQIGSALSSIGSIHPVAAAFLGLWSVLTFPAIVRTAVRSNIGGQGRDHHSDRASAPLAVLEEKLRIVAEAAKPGACVSEMALLMSATAHDGKGAEFQLFMGLLDVVRLEGRLREGVHKADVSDIMRHLTEEELCRFDGTRLFPGVTELTYEVPQS